MTIGALTIITATSINGLEEAADEWEEIEFMVDSGVGAMEQLWWGPRM